MRPTSNITPTKKPGSGKTPLPYAPIPYPGPKAPGKTPDVVNINTNPPKPKKNK
jgi:hypothetical protein